MGDPVQLGLAESYNRPGRNITGIDIMGATELETKQIGLLHDLVPQATTLGFLVNPAYLRARAEQQAVEEAARALKLKVLILSANSDGEIEKAFAPSGPLHSSIRAARSSWPCNLNIGCRRLTRFVNTPPKAE